MPSAPVIPAPCHCEFVTLGSGSAAHLAQCPEHVTHSTCTETSQLTQSIDACSADEADAQCAANHRRTDDAESVPRSKLTEQL